MQLGSLVLCRFCVGSLSGQGRFAWCRISYMIHYILYHVSAPWWEPELLYPAGIRVALTLLKIGYESASQFCYQKFTKKLQTGSDGYQCLLTAFPRPNCQTQSSLFFSSNRRRKSRKTLARSQSGEADDIPDLQAKQDTVPSQHQHLSPRQTQS